MRSGWCHTYSGSRPCLRDQLGRCPETAQVGSTVTQCDDGSSTVTDRDGRKQVHDITDDERRVWDLDRAQPGSSHYESRSYSYVMRCYSYVMKGSYDLALTDCNEAIRLNPKSQQAFELRSKIYSAKGQTNLAVSDHAESIRLTALANKEELRIQKTFWEEQAFNCRVGSDIYPSKNDEPYDPMRRYNPAVPKTDWETDYITECKPVRQSSEKCNCDDGDMTYFNSLLCAAGDNRGGRGVEIAQGEDGRWWRSKRLIGQSDSGGASFSTEQGLGVYNYLVKTGTAKKEAFTDWLDWIGRNPRIYAPLPENRLAWDGRGI
jgi:hypothetical protein